MNSRDKQIKRIRQVATIETDDENRDIIKIDIEDGSKVISSFSAIENPIMSREMADYLNHVLHYVRPEKMVHVHLTYFNVPDDMFDEYTKCIKNYYMISYNEMAYKIKKNNFLCLFMVVISACIFFISWILKDFQALSVPVNMVDVVAWVFLWEAVDKFFFERPRLRREQFSSYKMLKAKYTYINDKY